MTENERDWLAVVRDTGCDECGLDPAGVPRDELEQRLRAEADAWATLLAAPDDALRHRPAPRTWSPLEYACHVRDVFAVFADRAHRALQEPKPRYGWWDHDAAVEDAAYNAQVPSDVATALRANAERLADVSVGLDDDGWSRVGIRRDDERMSVEAHLRFALHESVHHRHDATAP